MTHFNEIDTFRATWNSEAECTLRLLDALPTDQYDFRPDPKGRSIGELAWHLSEIDACLSFGIAERRFRFEDEPPNLKRPREIQLLAPGYRRVHAHCAGPRVPRARYRGSTSPPPGGCPDDGLHLLSALGDARAPDEPSGDDVG